MRPSPTSTTTLSPTPFPWQPLFEEVTSISEAFPDATRSGELFIAEDNSLMMIIDGLIVKWVGNKWETVLEEWPGSLTIWEGQIWAYDAETGALSHWQNGTWQSYGPEEGWIKPEDRLSRRSVQSAIYDDAGRLWLPTGNDVRMLDNGRWTIFTPADMGIPIEPDPTGVTSHSFAIQPVPKLGEVWVGHCQWIPPGPNGGTGLYRFDGRTWQASPISELSDGCTIGMAADEFGRVFVSQDATLWYYDLGNQAWRMFDSPDSFLEEQYVRYGAIIDISIAPTGHIWPLYMACGGASCAVGEHRYLFFEDGTFFPMWHPGDEARMPFVMLENGRVFKLAPTGLYEITNNTSTLLLEPGILFGQLVADANGNVWATSVGAPIYLLKLKTE